MATLAAHQHGKSRVRVARVWRQGDVHTFVEFNVHTMLESDMEHAFVRGDNTDMTATDTQKNTVYYIAKKMTKPCSPEEFGVELAKHFVKTYPRVSMAKVKVEMKPWTRISMNGRPHNHGYQVGSTEVRTAYVTYDDRNRCEITAGCKDLSVLKTTQSGYEGYCQDKFTLLPETRERIMATTVTATWKYSRAPVDFDRAYNAVKAAFCEKFFGPVDKGVYSPSVQYTLYEMGVNVIKQVGEVDSIFFNMPNLHFLPCNPVASTAFDNDVYVATGEPHGNIEAVVTRAHAQPHARL